MQWPRMQVGFPVAAAASCGSAILLLLSFPRFDISLLAWVGLVPLFLVLDGRHPSRAFLLSFFAGLVLFTGIFSWIWTVPAFNLLDYLLLAAYLSFFLGLFGLTLAWIRLHTGASLSITAPPLWVALEYARAHAGFLGAPWMLLGHSQYSHPVVIQIVSLTGVYGVSFLIVLVNSSITEFLFSAKSLRARPGLTRARLASLAPILISACAVLLTLAYGQGLLSRTVEGPSLQVALIQGNIPYDQKWDPANRQRIMNQHARLTRLAAVHHPDLIVWPETAVPGDVKNDPDLRSHILELAHETSSHLLVGTAANAKFSENPKPAHRFNSLVLITPDGHIGGEYRKIRLVPFAEYIPLRDLFTWPTAIASGRTDILPGDRITLFSLGSVTFGATICWENIFPDLVREVVKADAGFLVNATNESWFGDSAAPYQFLAMNVFRAAEHRIAIARATNTGISAFIDPFGRVRARLVGSDHQELFTEGILLGAVTVTADRTFYTHYGDVFAWLQIAVCLAFLSLALVSLLLQHPRSGTSPQEDTVL